MVSLRVGLVAAILMLEGACDHQPEQARNDTAIAASQERTMKEANDDVEAAMAESGMINASTAQANTISPGGH